MKRHLAFFTVLLTMVSTSASADNFSFSYYSSGYQPYRTYHYIEPQTLYLAPYGAQTFYVERRVVRPYYYPVYKNKWHDRHDRRDWRNGHHRGRGHDGHDRRGPHRGHGHR